MTEHQALVFLFIIITVAVKVTDVEEPREGFPGLVSVLPVGTPV